MQIQILVITIVRGRRKHAHARPQCEQERIIVAHEPCSHRPRRARVAAENVPVAVFHDQHAGTLPDDAAEQRREALAVHLRGKQEAPLVAHRRWQCRINEKNLRDVRAGGKVGCVMQAIAAGQQGVRLTAVLLRGGGGRVLLLRLEIVSVRQMLLLLLRLWRLLIGMVATGGRLGVSLLLLLRVLRRSVLKQVQKDMRQHAQKGRIVLQPAFRVGARHFLRVQFGQLVRQALCKLLHALVHKVKAVRLPRLELGAALKSSSNQNWYYALIIE